MTTQWLGMLIWLSMGYFCARMAEEKHRNVGAWALSGFLFGFFALIILYMLPAKRRFQ